MISEKSLAGLFAALGVFAIFLVIIVVALVVVMIIAEIKLYKKAGKAGWEAIVPFYGYWVLVEIAGLNWWWFLIIIFGSLKFMFDKDETSIRLIMDISKLFGAFVCNFNIAKKLHKDTGFAILMTIFPIVMIPLIGFSKDYQFDNSVKVTPNGPFDANKNDNTNNNVNKNISNSTKFCSNCGESINGDKFCPNCGSKIE